MEFPGRRRRRLCSCSWARSEKLLSPLSEISRQINLSWPAKVFGWKVAREDEEWDWSAVGGMRRRRVKLTLHPICWRWLFLSIPKLFSTPFSPDRVSGLELDLVWYDEKPFEGRWVECSQTKSKYDENIYGFVILCSLGPAFSGQDL